MLWTDGTLRNLRELKAFLGTVGYYHQYIENYATVARPLPKLTCKGVPFDWTEVADRPFHTLKGRLVCAPVLGYPDPRLPYVLDTDASNEAIGAVLSQVQEGRERVISYYSKTLNPAEVNYCVTRKELLAVVRAVQHFRPFLYGRTFHVRTNHASRFGCVDASSPLAKKLGGWRY